MVDITNPSSQKKKTLIQIAIMLLLLCADSYAQGDQFFIKHVTRKDGLSNSEVTAVAQDSRGFLWIGTRAGLNRYDGQSIKVYRNMQGDTTSLADNSITTLFVNKQGELWIGTENNGLSIYDASHDNFRNYSWYMADPGSLSFNYVTSIEQDTEGTMWVATLMGLNKYNPHADNFERYLREVTVYIKERTIDSLRKWQCPNGIMEALQQNIDVPLNNGQFVALINNRYWIRKAVGVCDIDHKGDPIRVIESDNAGNLWLGFERDGLGKFDPVSKSIVKFPGIVQHEKVLTLFYDNGYLWIGTEEGHVCRYSVASEKLDRFRKDTPDKFVKAILRDSHGRLWIGDSRGLNLFHAEQNEFFRVSFNEQGEQLINRDVSFIFEDMHENLWVCSSQGGLSLLKYEPNFKRLTFDDDAEPGRPKVVSAVLEDEDQNLWVGYFTSGVDFFPRAGGRKISFPAGQAGGLGNGSVHVLFEDRSKNIWVGTYEGGLQRYDREKKRFVSYNFLQNGKTIQDVRSISEDAHGNLWIAVHGDGIKKLDPATGQFSHYRANYQRSKKSLSNDWTFSVYCDTKDRVWAGGVMGVSVFQKDGGVRSFNEYNSNLSHNSVRMIFEDSQGRIWVGTESGLNLFEEGRNTFRVFNEIDGLPDGSIKSIQEDSMGFLWISTNNGLSKCNFEKGIIKTYLNSSNFLSNEFFENCSAASQTGKFYFGGKYGLDCFFPEQILDYPHKPPVVITDFKVFNRSVAIGNHADAILPKSILHTDQITLPYDQNIFTFEFTAINYLMPERNCYAYYLEGFEKNWNIAGNKKEATYTNLDPGDYVFHVKGANHDGVWNSVPVSVAVRITPPWWLSIPAKVSYVFVFILIAWLARKAIISRIKLKHRLELDEMKLRFFANVSHELRTPLTLILSPLADLVSDNKYTERDKHDLLGIIYNNAKRLLCLINQLMNIHEVDAGIVRLRVREGNVMASCRRIFDAFQYDAKKRGINYNMRPCADSITGYFDADKIEKILINIIGNAFKYSQDDGSITLDIMEYSADRRDEVPRQMKTILDDQFRCVRISVSDTGHGIPSELQEKVFERFFRIDNERNTGTGIGLTLARQLARLHKGDITVVSAPDKGTVFSVWIPLHENAFNADERDADVAHISPVITDISERDISAHSANDPGNVEANLPVLTVIDDNEDIRRYIHHCFKDSFQVLSFPSGEEGVPKVMEIIPDLLICDIMLPGSSGFEICSRIKKDKRTSHIPVILLTAKTSDDSQLRGLAECGADDYITKPFNAALLRAKVKNIYAYRKKLRKILQLELQSNNDTERFSAEDIFIKSALDIVEKNIDNPDFDVNALCREIGMSQTNLYRKLQGVVGLSANQFIKNVRLKRAACLLKKGYTVMEAAYMVGFRDPKYFSKVFKKQYNKLPHEYSKAELSHEATNALEEMEL